MALTSSPPRLPADGEMSGQDLPGATPPLPTLPHEDASSMSMTTCVEDSEKASSLERPFSATSSYTLHEETPAPHRRKELSLSHLLVIHLGYANLPAELDRP